jgi:hypothetical protein
MEISSPVLLSNQSLCVHLSINANNKNVSLSSIKLVYQVYPSNYH